RAIHDRYHAAKRNPFNEIECSDQYARAMASYGTFITASCFEYHGPKGDMRFPPAFGKQQFRAPFTAAEGWGTFSQQGGKGGLRCSLSLGYGTLQLRTLRLQAAASAVTATVGGKKIPASVERDGREVRIR